MDWLEWEKTLNILVIVGETAQKTCDSGKSDKWTCNGGTERIKGVVLERKENKWTGYGGKEN